MGVASGNRCDSLLAGEQDTPGELQDLLAGAAVQRAGLLLQRRQKARPARVPQSSCSSPKQRTI